MNLMPQLKESSLSYGRQLQIRDASAKSGPALGVKLERMLQIERGSCEKI